MLPYGWPVLLSLDREEASPPLTAIADFFFAAWIGFS
jgi:hypothetical protein